MSAKTTLTYLIYILADRVVGAQRSPSVRPSSRTPVQTLGAGIKTQWVSEGSLRHVRCVPFWRKINGFRGNQRSCSSKNIGWSFFLFGRRTTQSSPPGGHKVIHRTAQTAFVRVVTPREILLFVFLFFRTELFIWFFVEESVAKGFIDCCVCDSSCRFLRRTTGKIL